jgi:hypothetical protein
MRNLFRKKLFLLILLVLLSFHNPLSLGQRNQLSSTQVPQVIQSLNNLPLYFVENEGQFEEGIKYQLDLPNGVVDFSSNKIHYRFLGRDNDSLEAGLMPNGMEESEKIRVDSICVTYLGANEEVIVVGEDESEAKFNYYKGTNPQDWITGARVFHNVLYQELYPNIDIIVHGGSGILKHDYRVKVGGNVEDIKVHYDGIKGIKINEKGQLEIQTEEGVLIEGFPMSYQVLDGKRVEVEATYEICRDNTIEFKVGRYDKGSELIIDPPLEYSTRLHTQKFRYSMAVDDDGCAYFVYPEFYYWNWDYTKNCAYHLYDARVIKFRSDGSDLEFSTTIITPNCNESNMNIALDEEGDAYFTVERQGGRPGIWCDDFPVSPWAYSTVGTFVVKLDDYLGEIEYATGLGTVGYIMGIAVDSHGYAHVTGIVGEADGSGFDACVLKLNHGGSDLEYSTGIGGSDQDFGSGIAIDGSDNAYVVGHTYSPDFPTTPGAYDTSHNGGSDLFLAKLNSSGSVVYSTYLGGSEGDQVTIPYGSMYGCSNAQFYDNSTKIAVDGSGNAHIIAKVVSADFPTTPGAYDTNGGTSIVAKLNSTGSDLIYSTWLEAEILAITLDEYGNAVVTGSAVDGFETTPNAYDTTFNGAADAILTKLNSSGTGFLYSTYLGGSDHDEGWGIAIDPLGFAYVYGGTNSTDFPLTPGAYMTDTGHHSFLTKTTAPFQFPIFDSHDFDGNGTSDISLYRPTNGLWYISGVGDYQWGAPGDIPVQGNYDLDAATEIAIFRPSSGLWYVYGGATTQWGAFGDIPVPQDYSGDGVTDLAVWRPSDGVWYINGVGDYQWGQGGDYPVPGDYNGDGVDEVAVWRPAEGTWYLYEGGYYDWGSEGDIPVPADYTGDGYTDLAVFRPANGMWYILYMGGGTGDIIPWGMMGDVPVPGDYNNDGTTDVAVFRPSSGLWYIKDIGTYQWGTIGDIPLVR